MQVNVHGCRGSIPSCSEETVGYGGNTSCYEIRFDNFQIIIDSGSGFRTVKLDPNLTKIILYSHWHHDHIQGLPFNSDIFNSANEISLCSALSTKRPFRHTLQTYFSGGYFPVDIVTVLKNLKFFNVSELQQKFKTDFKLDWLELNHPGGSAGYSVHYQDKKFCYLCDNEYETSQLEALADFCKSADLVIWDGMFTDDELTQKKGWGHSSIEQALDFFEAATISKVLISHHDPSRTDVQLDNLARSLPEGVDFAKDGMSISI